MARNEQMCTYGNCEQTIKSGESFKCTVTLTHHGNRLDNGTFCSIDHAILWAGEQQIRYSRLLQPKEAK